MKAELSFRRVRPSDFPALRPGIGGVPRTQLASPLYPPCAAALADRPPVRRSEVAPRRYPLGAPAGGVGQAVITLVTLVTMVWCLLASLWMVVDP